MVKYFAFLFLLLASNVQSQTTIYQTDFQAGIPAEMTLIDNDLNTPNQFVSEYTAAWICVEDPENPTDSVAASTSYFATADTADRWLITPSLLLGAFGNKFSWNAKSQDPSFPDDYYILVSTSDNSIGSFTDTVGYIEAENFEWNARNIDLSAFGYDDQTIYIAFVLRTYDGFKLYIDDLLAVKEDDASLPTQESISFALYPVPVIDRVKVSCDQFIERIIIKDLLGNLLYEGTSMDIDLQLFAAGSYLMTVYTDDTSNTKTFIKI